jgi:putative hemolysin
VVTLKDVILPMEVMGVGSDEIDERLVFVREIVSFMKSNVRRFIKHSYEVDMISHKSKVIDLIRTYKISKHHYYPVFRNSRDEIIGIIDVTDILDVNPQEEIVKFLKKCPAISDNYPAYEFIRSQIDFALVYDQLGNFTGIITRKEILRHLFNIFSSNFKRISANTYIIEMPADLGFVEELTGVYIGDPNKGLAELLVEVKNGLLEEGDSLIMNGLKFTVLKKEENRIERIKLEKL